MKINQRLTVSSSDKPYPLTANIESAVLRTVAYVDVFNYPLTFSQIHRYLEGVAVPAEVLKAVMGNGRLIPHKISRQDNYFMLPDREAIVAIRQERESISRQLWPRAIRYGRLMARLPFVRMVAVTGSLTMNNADKDADIDYLIVTEDGRLWLCRAFIIALVRLARKEYVELCPNYILSEKALEFTDRNLYTAHELAQMVPISGLDVYHQIRRVNDWTNAYLPNAIGAPGSMIPINPGFMQKIIELPFRTAIGHYLDRWEMNRKIRKLAAQETGKGETFFSVNYCKGHFDAHNRPVMTAYQRRIKSLK